MPAGRLILARRGGRRRRRPRSRFYKGYQKSMWSPNISLCPDKMFVKLKSTNFFELSGGGLVANRIFRGNYHVDPDFTAPGPSVPSYGSHQWENFYHRAYCTSSTITVRIINTDNTITQLVVFPATTNFTSSSIENATNRARSKTVLVANSGDMRVIKCKGSNKAVIGERWNSTQTYITNSDAAGPYPPTRQWFWHIAAKTLNGLSSIARVTVEIEYNVAFYDRRPVLGSGGSSA